MRELAKRLVVKAACRLGLHSYSPVMLSFRFIDNGELGMRYVVENECVFCGGKYKGTVVVPYPKKEESV